MKKQKFKTNFPNIRYYEHSTRKMHNGQAYKYYSIGHRYKGRTIEEGLGWASERKALPKCAKPSLINKKAQNGLPRYSK